MKTLIVYSSRTGNTQKVADAIAEVLPGCALHPVDSAPPADAFDFVCIGYWVDKGGPDAAARAYMEGVRGKTVALFGTLGAWPDSDHARDCRSRGEECLGGDRGNTVLGTFLCQGKIDPGVLAMMAKMAGDIHPMTPEREARIAEAAKHPDAEDLGRARETFLKFRSQAESASRPGACTC